MPFQLTGAAEPGADVVLTLHRADVTGFVPSVTVRADRNGRWKATVTASVNTRYLATSAGHASPTLLVGVK